MDGINIIYFDLLLQLRCITFIYFLTLSHHSGLDRPRGKRKGLVLSSSAGVDKVLDTEGFSSSILASQGKVRQL